jgi:hypothetical protein
MSATCGYSENIYSLGVEPARAVGPAWRPLVGRRQQMLAISRALMTNPRLLLLDGATEGLAPRLRAEIWRVLAALKSGRAGNPRRRQKHRAAAPARRPPLHPRKRPHGVGWNLRGTRRRGRSSASLSGSVTAPLVVQRPVRLCFRTTSMCGPPCDGPRPTQDLRRLRPWRSRPTASRCA